MQVLIHSIPAEGSFDALAALPRQELVHDWWGDDVEPSFEFAMAEDGDSLYILASRGKNASAQPGSELGVMYPKPLCDYDTAEFFMGQADGERYFEFHIAPSGAWWYSFFKAVRQVADDVENPVPQGVETRVCPREGGWLAMARIPLSEVKGIDLRQCRLAVTAILESPEYIYLTTADNLSGEPDFHRPSDWAFPTFPKA